MATKKKKKSAAKRPTVARPRKPKKKAAAARKPKQTKKKAAKAKASKKAKKKRPAARRSQAKRAKKTRKAKKAKKAKTAKTAKIAKKAKRAKKAKIARKAKKAKKAKKATKKLKATRAGTSRKKASAKSAVRAPRRRAPKPFTPPPPRKKEKPPLTPEQIELYKEYEAALRLLHQKKFRRAHTAFSQLLKKYPQETDVVARMMSFMRVCERQLEDQKEENGGTADEVFNQAVIHHNSSQFDEALDLYTRALKLSKKKKDHIYYALAATELSLGNTENALKHLAKAIEMNEENRFFAHNDPDFEPLAGNQKFRELVHPS